MRIALIGNPNSGKTTLFNELTGANQHVGNWPGVTVEKKEGIIRPQYGGGHLVDLPGIYSLSPFSLEEVVSRDFIIDEKPDVVIDIVDATNLERNLYLTIQLIELNVPLVVALNMMDEVEAEGVRIDTERLSKDIGVSVVPISAAKKTGIAELIEALPSAKKPKRHELPDPHLERLIALTEAILNDHLVREHHVGDTFTNGYPLHWTAIKTLESDELVLRSLTLEAEDMARINELKNDFEQEHTLLCTAFADARYRLIHHVINHGISIWSTESDRLEHLQHAHKDYHRDPERFVNDEADTDGRKGILDEEWDVDGSAEQPVSVRLGEIATPVKTRAMQLTVSDKIDRVLTHRIFAIPIFLVVIFFVFHLTFTESLFGIADIPGPGVWLQGLVESGVEAFSLLITPLFVEGSWAESLVIGGVIGGVGSVLSFVPQILLLFLFLTLLEDCGYMARAAFIMDRFLRRFGLSGKSFLPMLMGFGCSVPAAMAARTMENENDRRLTLMLVPFMSCGARAPIFLVLAGAFFPAYADIVVFSMYLLGIIVAVLSGILLRKLLFKGEFSPFIIELPRYRTPQARSVFMTLWDKFKGYLVRAGTIIFAMCVVIWALSSFGVTDGSFHMVAIEDSLLAAFGNLIAPVFTPLGFGTWIAAVAVLTGFIAKESVIGTLGTLLGISEDSALEGGGLSASLLAAAGFTPLSALSFMVFCLLYIPCMAAFATLKKEFGSWKWALGQAAYSVAVAYLISFAVFQIGSSVI
ncbi:MAG TPA: ferrous iron transport protein B [Coriobacteriia bacterium]|nr:ferrous iron transport protein B [Coriobacteriia bacterium]